jgi:PPOX class probable F420-dependent enzyme
MDPDEVRAFLSGEPPRPAVLATTRKDGRPHVTPVWYVLDDDGSIVFTTGADTVKGRTLRRTGWAAMTVDDDRPPFSFVTVAGPITISEDLGEVRAWAARIGGRYMGAGRADEYGERNGVPGELLVRLTPQSVASARDLAD